MTTTAARVGPSAAQKAQQRGAEGKQAPLIQRLRAPSQPGKQKRQKVEQDNGVAPDHAGVVHFAPLNCRRL
jgi:hypothetical protein